MFQRTASNARSGSRWRSSRIPRALAPTGYRVLGRRAVAACRIASAASSGRDDVAGLSVVPSAAATTLAWAA